MKSISIEEGLTYRIFKGNGTAEQSNVLLATRQGDHVDLKHWMGPEDCLKMSLWSLRIIINLKKSQTERYTRQMCREKLEEDKFSVAVARLHSAGIIPGFIEPTQLWRDKPLVDSLDHWQFKEMQLHRWVPGDE